MDSRAFADELLAPWSGPHNGAPPFDRVRVGEFEPALLAAMDEQRAELAAIAADPAPPTFANTLEAMERSGKALERAGALYGVWASTLNDKAMQAIQQQMAPVFAAFSDEVVQNSALFARIEAVYEARERSGLDAEQQRLAWVTYRQFARRGAALEPEQKARLGAVNQRLATLATAFSQNVLADEEEGFLALATEADLSGLPAQLIVGAAAAATARGLDGKWLITNTRSSVEPFLTYSSRRDLREQAFRMWTMRGDKAGPRDNKPIISEILQLRAEKASLLGQPTFAHWAIEDQMARTPQAAMALMLKVWPPARARALEEAADMQALADAEAPGTRIEPWDWRYYAEKVRKAKYDLDEAEIKPYLQLDNLREAMFWMAGQLYGFAFTPLDDLPTAHPDVRVWEVRRGGVQVGLWYLDPFARPGKSSGAWMSQYRAQQRLDGELTPIVSNNANFIEAPAGEPVLVSWEDAVTMFHEFGHALHGLDSSVTYPGLAGTRVARDFVEFPSQLHERWLPTPELLSRFARHYRTGEPMPDALVAKIKRAQSFNKGFATVEYLASAIVDMRAHLAGSAPIEPRAFETAILAEIGMPREIVMRHRMPQFGHIFASEGYAAGYYAYMWADTLTADAAEAFEAAPGGFYDQAVARRLHECVMSVGNTIDPAEAFRAFMGRDVSVDALMRDRGFPAPPRG
jgi:peptidyl-dipeptidase Dcp